MARTAAQLVRQYLDKPVAWISKKGVEWNAVVDDVRVRYGQEEILIRPEAGSGSQWVSVKSVRLLK